ncbi:hypothetical protein BDQ12DRAFT_668688 [Crucibulum laeve]|uniref:Uncharacterized protein n=1 Tax=Crucibulum laeve TaxID=68775 RepID=A0A5C3LR88_9AGAR|nr:hypothetical protein BDQ12DRAFT_668688 [Crucibulum laeve]
MSDLEPYNFYNVARGLQDQPRVFDNFYQAHPDAPPAPQSPAPNADEAEWNSYVLAITWWRLEIAAYIRSLDDSDTTAEEFPEIASVTLGGLSSDTPTVVAQNHPIDASMNDGICAAQGSSTRSSSHAIPYDTIDLTLEDDSPDDIHAGGSFSSHESEEPRIIPPPPGATFVHRRNASVSSRLRHNNTIAQHISGPLFDRPQGMMQVPDQYQLQSMNGIGSIFHMYEGSSHTFQSGSSTSSS